MDAAGVNTESVDPQSQSPMEDRLDIMCKALKERFNHSEEQIFVFRGGFFSGMISVLTYLQEAAATEDDASLARLLHEGDRLVEEYDPEEALKRAAFTMPATGTIQ